MSDSGIDGHEEWCAYWTSDGVERCDCPPVTTGVDDIVRRHYQTGEYGNAHFLMRRADWTWLGATKPKDAPLAPWSPERAISQLQSIPVVLDETGPAGQWRLVDNSTREVITEGTFYREEWRP